MSVHEHAAQPAARASALLARLERAGLTTEAELDAIVERFLLGARKENAYRVVARAWLDPDYRERLLADGNAALDELGIDMSHWAPVRLRVVANTPDVHNVIVCTLCSCYPIALLGPSPSWYKSEAYRSRVVRDPRAVLSEFGVELPPQTSVAVWDSAAEARYMVLPQRPAGTDHLREEQLAALVTRNGLIGTAPV